MVMAEPVAMERRAAQRSQAQQAQRAERPSRASIRAPLVKLVLALLFVPLMHPSVGRIDSPLFAPLPVFERLIAEAGGPRAPRFAPMLEQCDPNWREVLGEAPRAALSRR